MKVGKLLKSKYLSLFSRHTVFFTFKITNWIYLKINRYE